MENINIAEILNGCPKGTRLYSPCFGYMIFDGIDGIRIYAIDNDFVRREFWLDGTMNDEGECMLFPDKDQRNWSRFDSQSSVSYFIDECGKVWFHKGEKTEEDIRRSEFGNEFATREKAEYAAEKVRELLLSLRKEAGNE